MSPLSERLKRALELDNAAITAELDALSEKLGSEMKDQGRRNDFRWGAQKQHARTAPIVNALVECVKALESCHACWESTLEPHPRDAALARLSAAIEGRG